MGGCACCPKSDFLSMIYGTDLSLSGVIPQSAGIIKKEFALYRKPGMPGKITDKIIRRNFEKFFAG